MAYQIESILEETLQAVGGRRMVVGHTPQPMGANWYRTLIFLMNALFPENDDIEYFCGYPSLVMQWLLSLHSSHCMVSLYLPSEDSWVLICLAVNSTVAYGGLMLACPVGFLIQDPR